MENLESLYKELILEHNKNPRNFKKMEVADVILQAYNPFCGDKFKIYINLEGACISNAHFHGYGCAISKASTSILSEKLRGKSLDEAMELVEEFFKIVDEENPKEATGENEDLNVFQAANNFPGRVKCAVLGWEEMRVYFQKLHLP